ncbi:MAG: helix-turn-helix transcriptional regulator [Terracidiphilus sp.]|nr:helix-turn-helix transcriptional regulator [Terracidiphilus sp.]
MARGKRIRSVSEEQFNAEMGKRIEAIRRKRGFTQVDFARAVQISPQQLYWYEVGRNTCPPVLLARMAYVLVVALTDLVPEYICCVSSHEPSCNPQKVI